jgi:hypothetical protein
MKVQNTEQRNLHIILFTKYYLGDQIKDDGIGGVCSTHEDIYNTFWLEN